jgi:hypothetical protein
MITRTIISAVLVVSATTSLTVAPVAAQNTTITLDVLDRFLTAHEAERAELATLDPQLKAVDEKITKFRDCRTAFEAAGSASGSRMGGIAARAAIRARCGASSEDDFVKEKEALLAKPEQKALAAGRFRAPEWAALKGRLSSFYEYGDRSGFTDAELSALADRSSRFGSIFTRVAQSSGGERSGRGGRAMPGMWTADITWAYIGHMFSMMYISGANLFEKQYEPGQWTKWAISNADDPDERYEVERAFLGRTADGSEWWRTRSITIYKDDGRETADTVLLEALFKPQEDEYIRQLVRMRGKMPGDKEGNELMVPQHFAMLSSLGAFPFRPTPESVEGATVGTERVVTPGGSFTAKQVRFGGSGSGRQEWWLTDEAPGGWVRFRVSGEDPEDTFTMELIGHGTGAKSELGVM